MSRTVSDAAGDTRTEILVVGAGPAGCTLAHALAAGGREALLLDKAPFPRFKPCAGGIPARTWPRLGLEPDEASAWTVASVRLDGAWGGGHVEVETPGGAHVVDRAVFDQRLAARAAAAGARFRPACAVLGVERESGGFRVRTASGTVRARYLCACDGVFSPAGRALGFEKNRWGFCLEGDLPAPAGLAEADRRRAVFDLTASPGGYAWSFPRGDRFAVGIGGDAARDRGLRPRLAAFVRRVFGGDTPLPPLRGGMIPDFIRPRAAYARAGALLAGDAAGLVDPLTGEGIHYAVWSARLAAESLLADAPGRYDALLREALLPELVCARRYAKAFRATPAWMLAAMMRLPRFAGYANAFADLLAGRIGYADLGSSFRA